MNFRKTGAGISAFLITAGSLAAAPITAFAYNDYETTEQYFTEGKIKTHVYDSEDLTETQCRFYPKTPNVPYVSLAEFYRTLNNGEGLIITKNTKGTYDIKNILDASCEIDTDKDTFRTSDYYVSICFPIEEISSNSEVNNIIVLPDWSEESGEPHDMVIDFADYGMDLYGEESDIWFPLPTLCNMFSGMQHRGIYFNKELYYTYDFDFSALEEVYTSEGMESIIKDFENGRPEDLAQYNYNEICRVFDCDYGFPGSIPLTDAIKEKGLDGALSETNSDTKLVKDKLLSTDFFTYIAGLAELEMFTYDGGHTIMADLVLDYVTNEEFEKVLDRLKDDRTYELGVDILGMQMDQNASYTGAMNKKDDLFGKQDESQFYRYVIDGDTAYFSFDSFSDVDIEGWVAYYSGNGERPTDIITAFYDCVKDADKNPEVKNFIVDVSTNGGGLVLTDTYMMSLMGGEPVCYNEYRDVGVTTVENFIVDKNLDRKIDEKDDEVKFDLNFGVIESAFSFSSANEFASNAGEAGIMIIGEKSSGGSCCINSYTTPDGVPFVMSYRIKATNRNGDDIDLGIKPDYELVTVNDDGSKDFSKLYDFNVIRECFSDFYGKKNDVTTTELGDVNNDNVVDGRDATAVLTDYAKASTAGGKSEFTEVQKKAADVNEDGVVDGRDATAILTYYAYTSTASGQKLSIDEFLKRGAPAGNHDSLAALAYSVH